MEVINRFALEKHEGPYETWPSRSRLFVDGVSLPLRVPGYSLLHQFSTPHGYLLITDCDCPFEEATNFILISKTMKLLAYQMLFVPYGSFNLESVEWIDADRLRTCP